MIFTPIQYDSGRTKVLEAGGIKTFSKGDALTFSSGQAEQAKDGVSMVRFVALEDVTNSTAGDKFLATYTGHGIEFEAQTVADTNQDQVDLVFDLDDTHGKVENTKSGSYTAGNVFVVADIVGVPADRKVRGYFLDRVDQ